MTNSSLALKKRGGVRDVLVVALPMLLSMSFDTFMTFIDRLFLSKLGPAEMNAALGAGAVHSAGIALACSCRRFTFRSPVFRCFT